MIIDASTFSSESWGYRVSNFDTTRPANSIGTSITPGASNAKGSYTTIQVAGANTTTKDIYGVLVGIHASSVSGAARATLVDIGVDPSGGTSFSDKIPNLMGTGGSTLITNNGLGINYYFPIFAPSGSRFGARAQVNNATAGTLRVTLTLFGEPSRKKNLRYGNIVRAYGIDTADSGGTAVTPGQAAEGSWTELGTIASGQQPWWWQVGTSIDNATIAALLYHADLSIGDATNKHIVVQDQGILTGTSETLCWPLTVAGCVYRSSGGQKVYGRSQCSGTPDSGYDMAAWGVI